MEAFEEHVKGKVGERSGQNSTDLQTFLARRGFTGQELASQQECLVEVHSQVYAENFCELLTFLG